MVQQLVENQSARQIEKESRVVDVSTFADLLPEDYDRYTDKYFIRSLNIVKDLGINPVVRAQVFIRKGPGVVKGIDEAIALIDGAGDFFKNGGKAFTLDEGDEYSPRETLMVLEGKLQDLIALETLYLGVLSSATTFENGGPAQVDLDEVTRRTKAVVEIAGERPFSYFGARHWHWSEDRAIGEAARIGGAVSASTDAGSAPGEFGVGTIPHVLENVFAATSGKDEAVVRATMAFDAVIDQSIPRIALIDYNNKEIADSIAVARALGDRLYGVRVDTCGENVAEGAVPAFDSPEADAWRERGLPLISENHPDAQFWYGRGVTVTGVIALRKALDDAGFADKKIILTSGFGNPNKVEAFVRAEKLLNIKLFDGLGVGELFPTRASTMDIVAVQDGAGEWIPMSKVGREYRPNERLKEVIIER